MEQRLSKWNRNEQSGAKLNFAKSEKIQRLHNLCKNYKPY